MKNYQFFALQCSIFLVGSFATTSPVTKMVCLGIAAIYLILQFAAIRNGE
jgi:hypothetical protein